MQTRDESGQYTPQPINHGTIGGYMAHYRRGEPRCTECLKAWSDYYNNRAKSITADKKRNRL